MFARKKPNQDQATDKKDGDIKKDSAVEIAETKEPKEPSSKKWLIGIICGIIGLLGGVGCFLAIFLIPKEALPDLLYSNTKRHRRCKATIWANRCGRRI